MLLLCYKADTFKMFDLTIVAVLGLRKILGHASSLSYNSAVAGS